MKLNRFFKNNAYNIQSQNIPNLHPHILIISKNKSSL